MVEQLKSLFALAEDLGLILTIHVTVHNLLCPRPKYSNTIFWPPLVAKAGGAHKCMQALIPIKYKHFLKKKRK